MEIIQFLDKKKSRNFFFKNVLMYQYEISVQFGKNGISVLAF